MEYIIPGLCVFTITSLALYIIFLIFSSKHQIYLRDETIKALRAMISDIGDKHVLEISEIKDALRKAKKEPTYDAQELLQDLLGGYGLIRVERLSPIDYFIKSPKG